MQWSKRPQMIVNFFWLNFPTQDMVWLNGGKYKKYIDLVTDPLQFIVERMVIVKLHNTCMRGRAEGSCDGVGIAKENVFTLHGQKRLATKCTRRKERGEGSCDGVGPQQKVVCITCIRGPKKKKEWCYAGHPNKQKMEGIGKKLS